MACSTHDWFFDTICPLCTKEKTGEDNGTSDRFSDEQHGDGGSGSAPDTAVVGGAPVGDGKLETVDPFEIPDFLRRPIDKPMPEPLHAPSDRPVLPAVKPYNEWEAAELTDALESALVSCEARQPIIMELRRREDKAKSYARLNKAKLIDQEK
jgi:hypothetical protein